MDKSAIKSFAVNSRIKLKEQIEQKAYTVGITKNEIKKPEVYEDTFEINGNKFPKRTLKHRESLVSKINELGFDQVIEKVAYIWFNRLIAIRFMEVNEYLPSGVRVLSSTDSNKSEPDIIREAANLDFENLNLDLIYRLQDDNNIEELFKYLLIKQCNELGKIMPEVFEEIENFTELLLPDNLLQEGSIVRDLITSIAEDDWKDQVEIIGWLYQYYISEKKDEVFEGLKKNIKITKENIPAATQLFTPDWIVKYMVENSLGRLWLEGHPNEKLKSKWKYYLEEAEQEPEVQKQLDEIKEKNKDLKPEDIKFLDPCMGSGHILVYAFEVLYDIYKSTGYSERDIPKLILENNLYGLEIDDRAAQLSYFAVMMKARSYSRRVFRERVELNICAIQESNEFSKGAIDYFVNTTKTENEKEILREDVEYLINVFIDAKEYGSILEVKKIDFDTIERRIREIQNSDIAMFELYYKNIILEKIPYLIKQASIMSNKYDVVCTNPPYMGNNGMNSKLSNYLKKYYEKSKYDLFAAFIERGFKYIKHFGYNVMVTMQTWMFLSSFEELRKKIINQKQIVTLLHMDNNVMGIAFGTCATVWRKIYIDNYAGCYRYVNNKELINSELSHKEFKNPGKIFISKTNKYNMISSCPIAYWVKDEYLDNFISLPRVSDFMECKSGIMTGADKEFLRYWHEVNFDKIGFELTKSEDISTSTKKWFPLNKGGNYRKWYGNNEYIINMENNGRDIINYTNNNYRLRDPIYYFREGITWSELTNGNFSARYSKPGMLFGSTGPMAFPKGCKEDIYYILAILNSKVGMYTFNILNPTIHYNVSIIGMIPVYMNNSEIYKYVVENIKIAEDDWNMLETSWEFEKNFLIKYYTNGRNLESAFEALCEYMNRQYIKMKLNEEKINEILINEYGLSKELNPYVDEKDISIRKPERVRDIKLFISYAVGCMFGRYALDEDGLIYAGGELNDKWKIKNEKCQVRKITKDEKNNILEDIWIDSTFSPDADNIIPITDDEYFEDDIVTSFTDFVKITFSEKTLEENLDYIADTLGKKANETSRQTIRRFFLKDFYKDHLQTYQKRPIYWLFDSGKNDGFKALIYMHRYDVSTVAKVRTDYLHPLQRKYEAEIARLDMVLDSHNASTREKNEARKKKEKIQKQIIECAQYDQVIAHVANQKIEIDLDDGVVVNYAKFQGVEVPQGEGKKPFKADLLVKI